MKIIDCTLRDGGYYTQWHFTDEVVSAYLQAMNVLPVDYVEVGYRDVKADNMGVYGYMPVEVLKDIRPRCVKKLAVMINEKSVRQDEAARLLSPIYGMVEMVRMAVNPQNLSRAVNLAKTIKDLGFEVCFNLMYMSMWTDEVFLQFSKELPQLENVASLIYMMDSYGGADGQTIRTSYKQLCKLLSCPIGFHGHNNLQLSLANTILAKSLGCEYADTTVLGMGRGAGNLPTELLLTYLQAHEGLSVDYLQLNKVVATFTPLKQQYGWGTCLPYMMAGAHDIPQKQVMDMVTKQAYPVEQILQLLQKENSNN